jgi:glutamate dehydrogenase/leucine dehydrogenase
VNGLLRELERRKTELAKTSPRLAQAQFDRIARKLDSWKMSRFCDVHDRADREQVSLRDAAYPIVIERVARACRARGLGLT